MKSMPLKITLLNDIAKGMDFIHSLGELRNISSSGPYLRISLGVCIPHLGLDVLEKWP